LLEQAKRQEVAILPIDVNISEWDCTLEADSRSAQAIRLGMRLVRGLRKEEAERLLQARSGSSFTSIAQLADLAALPKRAVNALALGGAFRSITEHRNLAFWNALGVDRLPGMLRSTDPQEAPLQLPAPSEREEIFRDYRQLGFSSGRHPLALFRSRLRALDVVSRKELNSLQPGRTVRVCGLVTHLQHPQTAKGVIFASLEDETGINNIIFWPRVFDEYRHRILGSNLMVVSGELQSQEGVVHVVAAAVEDYSHWVRTLPRNSRDFH
jgi:error-prone DNA polymerase